MKSPNRLWYWLALVCIVTSALFAFRWYNLSPTEHYAQLDLGESPTVLLAPAPSSGSGAPSESTEHEVTPRVASIASQSTGPECEHEYNENDELIAWHNCEMPIATDVHPYWSYPLVSLRDMAHGDADAAEIFGIRVLETKRPGAQNMGLDYVLRAVALGGTEGPINRIVARSFSKVSDANGPAIDTITKAYILREVSNRITGKSTNISARQLEKNGFDSAAFVDLGARADQLYAYIKELRLEVTGEQEFLTSQPR